MGLRKQIAELPVLWLAEKQFSKVGGRTMQVSLEEVRNVLRAYRIPKRKAVPTEFVPEPVKVAPEADQALAREIAKQLTQQPEVREERIQQVRSSVESGVYQVPALVVAGAMIRRLLADRIE